MKMEKSAAVQLKHHTKNTIEYVVIVVVQTWNQSNYLAYLGIRI